MNREVLLDKEEELLLCTLPFPENKEIIDRIRKSHPHIKVVYHTLELNFGNVVLEKELPDGKSIARVFRKATILVTLSALPRPEWVPNLKYIHMFSAGVNHINHTSIYMDTDIPITTSSGIHGPMIAEWVIMQVLSNSHKQKQLLDWQHKHEWGSNLKLMTLRDSVGMRLGVLGYGSIGRQVARVCKAMGMDVISYTASPRTTPYSKEDKGYIVPGTGDPDGTIPSAWYSGTDKASLHNFLAQDIDVLLVAVPLTKETRHLLAAREFEILGKKNAFIVNISRGSIVNQTDLITFLKKDEQEGGLRGAALDVTDPEPLPPTDPLWELENVTITPHISGLSMGYEGRSYEILERNLTNLEQGKSLLNLVDRKRGY